MKYILNCDGGSRGNPGPAASGTALFDENGELIARKGEYLGIQTNNYAEYHAVLIGVKLAIEHGATELQVRLDSQLIVRQMNGMYKIKNEPLRQKYLEIQSLLKTIPKYSFEHVYREYNKTADKVVNEVLDAHKGK